jgi:hypothetical protein
MALSKNDRAFYEEKLGYKTIGYLFGATMLIGGVMWPLLLFIQDWTTGLAGRWTFNVAFDWSMIGLMLGAVVAAVMFLLFKFLLAMGWLPSRR